MQKSRVKSKESEHTNLSEQHKPQPLKKLVNAFKHAAQEIHNQHESRVKEHEEERRHNEAMHHAEEERIRIENQRAQEKLQRDRRHDQQHNIDAFAGSIIDALEHARLEQEKVRHRIEMQSEFDRQRCRIEFEVNQTRSEAESLMKNGQFSAAIDKFNLAISKVELLAVLWVKLQNSLGYKVRKYDYADGVILQLKEQCRQAGALLEQLNRKLAWEKQRETLLPKYNLILGNISQCTDLNSLLYEFKSLRAILVQNSNSLNPQEEDLLKDINISITKYEMSLQAENQRRMISEQRAKNIELQISVHNKINLATQKIEIGDIHNAFRELKQAKNLAARISDFNDVVDQPKTIPTYFDASLQVLSEQCKDFDNRAQCKSHELATEIINRALSAWGNHNVVPNLYMQHRVDLHKALVNGFTDNWHKFDRRERDEDLVKKIWELINSRLKIIGWIKWFQDTSKTISIHEFDNCLEQVRLILNAYAPSHNPGPISLSIGLTFFQAEEDLIPTAQVVTPSESSKFEKLSGLKLNLL